MSGVRAERELWVLDAVRDAVAGDLSRRLLPPLAQVAVLGLGPERLLQPLRSRGELLSDGVFVKHLRAGHQLVALLGELLRVIEDPLQVRDAAEYVGLLCLELCELPLALTCPDLVCATVPPPAWAAVALLLCLDGRDRARDPLSGFRVADLVAAKLSIDLRESDVEVVELATKVREVPRRFPLERIAGLLRNDALHGRSVLRLRWLVGGVPRLVALLELLEREVLIITFAHPSTHPCQWIACRLRGWRDLLAILLG